jgi:hypothetical protein
MLFRVNRRIRQVKSKINYINYFFFLFTAIIVIEMFISCGFIAIISSYCLGHFKCGFFIKLRSKIVGLFQITFFIVIFPQNIALQSNFI